MNMLNSRSGIKAGVHPHLSIALHPTIATQMPKVFPVERVIPVSIGPSLCPPSRTISHSIQNTYTHYRSFLSTYRPWDTGRAILDHLRVTHALFQWNTTTVAGDETTVFFFSPCRRGQHCPQTPASPTIQHAPGRVGSCRGWLKLCLWCPAHILQLLRQFHEPCSSSEPHEPCQQWPVATGKLLMMIFSGRKCLQNFSLCANV